MNTRLPLRCVETGEGVAVWEADIPPEPQVMRMEEGAHGLEDAPTYTTVTLYRPVKIQADTYGGFEAVCRANGGWQTVPDKYIRNLPPKRSHRAERFGVTTPEQRIDREDVPEEFLND